VNREERERYDQGSRRTQTFAASLKHRNESYRIEDSRWSRSKQIRDWMIVVLAIFVLDVVYVLVQAYLEPGLGGLG